MRTPIWEHLLLRTPSICKHLLYANTFYIYVRELLYEKIFCMRTPSTWEHLLHQITSSCRIWSRSRPIREHNSTSLKRTPSTSDHEIMPYVVTLKTDGKHVLIGLTGKPMSIAGLFSDTKQKRLFQTALRPHRTHRQAHEHRRSLFFFERGNASPWVSQVFLPFHIYLCYVCAYVHEGGREREREWELERERERERERIT